MKNILAFLLYMIPAIAFAQVQGTLAGQGLNGQSTLGVRNDADATINGLNLGWGNFSVTASGKIKIDPGTSATSLGKTEDAAHSSGDTGVMSLGVRNQNRSVLVSTELDYGAIAVSGYGAVFTDNNAAWHTGNEGQYTDRAEDDAFTGGSYVKIAGAQRQDALTVDQGTSGDVGPIKIDPLGRLQVIPYAPPGDTLQGCSSSNTGTSDIGIISGIASYRIYVTSISCFNTSAVASSISFKNGSSQIYAGGIGASTTEGVGTYTATLPVPLRTSVNTAFNFAMGTTATATTCCISGYVGAS